MSLFDDSRVSAGEVSAGRGCAGGVDDSAADDDRGAGKEEGFLHEKFQVGNERPFSVIYVEEKVAGSKAAENIIRQFPKAKVIPIKHYKDVFNRGHQNYSAQHRSQALILARKDGQLIYKGARVCQDFGNDNFYYTSCMMNCVFDCEYCFLKGMYQTGNLVVFLNLEDIFAEVEELLKEKPVYLCVSYDADLLAIEPITGYVRRWLEFTAAHENLTIEVRTKSAYTGLFAAVGRPDDAAGASGTDTAGCGAAAAEGRVIFAYTLSPDSVIRKMEHGTPSLAKRLYAADKAIQAGFPVRLCFDPMVYVPDWQTEYSAMLEEVFAAIPPEKVRDFSVGTFRIGKDYLKAMRRSEPYSAVVQFPFVNDGGICYYGRELTEEMERFMLSRLSYVTSPDRIFRWEE